MKEKIMIMSVMKYTRADEKTGEMKENTRVTYLLVSKDKFQDSENFKGFNEATSYFRGFDVFNKITPDLLGKSIDATFISKPDFKNPLQVRQLLQSIEVNGNIINLVQA